MKNRNLKSILATCLLASLSACGGGGIGSSSGFTPITTSPMDAGPSIMLSNATPMANINNNGASALLGTGYAKTISPSDMHTHYNMPATLTGAGQKIAIVNAPGSVTPANIIADLNSFSTYYKLPLQSATNNYFSQIDLSKGAKVAAANDWALEVALDVQWAHAIAPAAKIILVTAKSNAALDMLAAVQTAAAQPGVVVISMSYGSIEFPAETGSAYDGVLKAVQAQGIVLLAASGDSGNNGSNQIWPAASPYVTSVGGTTNFGAGNAAFSNAVDQAWAYGGGGASLYEPKPAYQTAAILGAIVTSLDPTKRAIPDVAYNADWVYSPVGVVLGGSWYGVGGTSAGAPQWAGIVALIAQQRVNNKSSTLQTLIKSNVNGINGVLYQATLDAAAMYDITVGTDNTSTKVKVCALCTAAKGYDAVTGLGEPNVTKLLAFF
jgi:subtilase family serine protease